MGTPDERGAIAFAEKVLALLDQGAFTSTYKFAVLLGLTDLCLAGFTRDGHAPDSVTTAQLARAVTALYWTHAAPFGAPQAVLRQNRGGQAEILTRVARARALGATRAATTLHRFAAAFPDEHARLLREVEWCLIEQPITLLQKFGRQEDRFIYELPWDRPSRRAFNQPGDFDNQLRFVGAAGDHLVRLAGLLRPLLQRRWAAAVSRMNELPESGLEDFLFGVSRAALAPVLPGLRALQDDRCFYCHDRLRQPEVDHFLPWARIPLDAIDNLVVADRRCNHSKLDFLAAGAHVELWRDRARDRAGDLATIARDAGWERDGERALGIARALYLPLAADARLWAAPERFVAPDRPLLVRALA